MYDSELEGEEEDEDGESKTCKEELQDDSSEDEDTYEENSEDDSLDFNEKDNGPETSSSCLLYSVWAPFHLYTNLAGDVFIKTHMPCSVTVNGECLVEQESDVIQNCWKLFQPPPLLSIRFSATEA